MDSWRSKRRTVARLVTRFTKWVRPKGGSNWLVTFANLGMKKTKAGYDRLARPKNMQVEIALQFPSFCIIHPLGLLRIFCCWDTCVILLSQRETSRDRGKDGNKETITHSISGGGLSQTSTTRVVSLSTFATFDKTPSCAQRGVNRALKVQDAGAHSQQVNSESGVLRN